MKKAPILLFLATLAGCSSIEPVVALPRADAESLRREDEFQQEASLERLRQQDARVLAVSYRINTANADLCEDKAALGGLALHHALQYGAASRATASRYFKLDGFPSVLAVAPGGAADKAGVRMGDTLLQVDGVSFNDAGARIADSKVTYDETLRAKELLDKALSDGAATLTVRRDGQTLTLQLQPVTGCAYEAQLIPSEDVSAWADGQRVFITTAFVRYAAADDQLAVVLGHELGHNVLKHRTRIKDGGPAGAILGNMGTAPGGLITLEREADYVGLYLMARAGYDYSQARDFWRQYGADYGRSRYSTWTHPGSLERAMNIGAAADEIKAKRERGEPLLPTRPQASGK
ncbi:M48 family metallopeptidase [Caulobacter mirabilis]|uniref:PDZ domain-containing protein n=1 Tax=Caulobacter mirabilis TaxID=69666 RepID=A0A2D2AT19_9CAUL|nr:M48 family metallopeptidase [Caulobacter mirabilis]ATQ41149.1 hypothetical protein CSW64_01345 [Caulobacter mirabilis]